MSFPVDPCETCPRVKAGMSLPCLGQTSQNPILCRRANKDDPDFREGYYNLVVEKKSEPKTETHPLTGNKVPLRPSKELIEKSRQQTFNTIREINDYNSKRVLNVNNSLKLIKECKHLSKKEMIIDEKGKKKFVHVITNDDGSKLTYDDCGCGTHVCGIGKGDNGKVKQQHCIDCVTETYQIGKESEDQTPNPGLGAPGLLKKAVNFAKATATHIAAGSPTRTEEDRLAILAICKSNKCGLYDPTKYSEGTCNHPSCGCDLSVKAGWADQNCPLDLWNLAGSATSPVRRPTDGSGSPLRGESGADATRRGL